MAGKKDLRYKVRFLQRVEIKRAPDDKRVGGYAVDVIPAGAIRELKASSVNFWKSRASAYGGQDVIEVLGRVEPEPEHVPEPVEVRVLLQALPKPRFPAPAAGKASPRKTSPPSST